MATIIHLGAGPGRDLPGYLATSPDRLLLVEPYPPFAKALHGKIGDHPAVQVRESAVAAVSGAGELRIFNHGDLNSLRDPTGLNDLYPGLRLSRTIPVEIIGIIDLLEPLSLSPDQNNQLIIDAPGEEGALLDTLIQAGQLHHFQTIVLNCGVRALYEGSISAEPILKQLNEHGYDFIAADDQCDADRPSWVLRRNDDRIENKQFREQLKEQGQGIKVITNQLEQATADRDAQAAERQALQHQLEQATADRDAQAAERQALQHQLEQATADRDAQANMAADRQSQVTQQAKSSSDYQQRITQLENQCRDWEQRQALMNEEMIKAEGQIELIKELLLPQIHSELVHQIAHSQQS